MNNFRKYLKVLIGLLVLSNAVLAQPGSGSTWAWLDGEKHILPYPIYGEAGKAAPANNPGKRNDAMSWKDNAGNFWFYGGYGLGADNVGYLEELWRYTPLTNEWTYVKGKTLANPFAVYGTKGVGDNDNTPGARFGGTTWTDINGNLWLYGGSFYVQFSIIGYKDLWKYNPVTNNWTWMSGDKEFSSGTQVVAAAQGVFSNENKPGNVTDASGWVDNAGDLWMLGGGQNRFWRYNIASDQWAWMQQSSPNPVISPTGTFSPGNSPSPGSRSYTWKDPNGDFWLFATNGSLWKFRPSINQWALIKGVAFAENAAVYGTLGATDVNNTPGTRSGGASWIDNAGNLWLFGGDAPLGRLNDVWKYSVAINSWTWVKGDNDPATSTPPVFGTQGVPNQSNSPGKSARVVSNNWQDDSGNFYFFGGIDYNDLWKYNPSLNEWTWVKGFANSGAQPVVSGLKGKYGSLGIPAVSNYPGARDSAVNWKDSDGNLWLFGGNGYAKETKGQLNDLWTCNIVTKEWTWIKGDSSINTSKWYGTQSISSSANKPGARSSAAIWSSKSNGLWLFGGQGSGSNGQGLLNDLWRFNIDTKEWTFVKGDSLINQKGVFGTAGIAGNTNKPGGRAEAMTWVDTAGNFWLMGGVGYASNGYGRLNDLWLYDKLASQWKFIGGDTLSRPSSYYDFFDKPQHRASATAWADNDNNLWLFGGDMGPGSSTYSSDRSNDLWKYSIAGNQWTKLKDWSNGQDGLYGTPGLSHPANTPPARQNATAFRDTSGNLWLFGGFKSVIPINSDAVSRYYYYNDLWKYHIGSNTWTWVKGSDQPNQVGFYGAKGIADAANNPGGRKSALGWTDDKGKFLLWGGYGFLAGGFGPLNDFWRLDTIGNLVLPISLVSFEARAEKTTAALAWRTSSEQNSKLFQIEHSLDGINFKSIGTVAATGNSSSSRDYYFTHFNPSAGINYYRLKFSDKDNGFTYSQSRKVTFTTNGYFVSLQFNPVVDNAVINIKSVTAEKSTIQITDLVGRVMWKGQLLLVTGNNKVSLQTSRWAKGVYHVQINVSNQKLSVTLLKH